ncbi:MAG: hypothetical protein IPH08_18335 [Rhodocyclaceae bacterium]|jgi:hypothetical protein|nr:hypothetical protein [Rhodocyclaceae bacterium]MBK6908958.1 hypothetical protein [Rhodocyclaceae bacterium]
MVNLAFQWHFARNALKNLNVIMDLPCDGLADGQPVKRETFAAMTSAPSNPVIRVKAQAVIAPHASGWSQVRGSMARLQVQP